jgi:hypothetical protein
MVFDALADVRYAGPLILETAAGEDPVESARRNADFVRARLAAAAGNTRRPAGMAIER